MLKKFKSSEYLEDGGVAVFKQRANIEDKVRLDLNDILSRNKEEEEKKN